MNKKILSIIAIFAFTSSLSGTETMFYAGKMNYHRSEKDKAYIGGVYFSQSFFSINENFKVSADAERTVFKYRNGKYYSQNDLTGRIDFFDNGLSLFLGGHKIFVKNNYSPWSGFIGLQYCKYGIMCTGAEAVFSDYGKSSLNKRNIVYQFSPYFGAYFINPYSYIAQYTGTFYTQIKVDYQKLSIRDSFNKKRYFSGEIKIINFHKDWSVEVEGEVGPSLYKVLNGGFIMRNIYNEQVLRSGKIKVNFTLPDKNILSFSYQNERLRFPDKTKGNNNIFLTMLTFYF